MPDTLELLSRLNPRRLRLQRLGVPYVGRNGVSVSGLYVEADTSIARRADTDAADSTNAQAIATHAARTDNPHAVTKAQVGLGNVDNTPDAAKPVSTAQAAADAAVQAYAIQRGNHTGSQPIASVTGLQTALDAKALATDLTAEATARANADALLIPLSQKGAANGVAPLDGSGKVASAYLPSYVDDVVEGASLAALQAISPLESGKIYVALDTNKTYRWTGTGTTLVEISASPGSTDSVTEGATNLYFTGARAIGAALTGFTAASTRTAVAATDSILAAFGKVQKYLNDLAAVAFSGSASDLGSGTLGAARLPAFGSGDVSFAAAGGAGTIANNAVTNAKAAQMAANTIKGNNTGSTANQLDLTAAQVQALIGLASTTTAGRLARYTDSAGTQGQTSGLYENGSGNVGIGTNNPGSKLTVNGDLQLTGTVPGLYLGTAGNSDYSITAQYGSLNITGGGTSNGLILSGSSSGNMKIDTLGRVGIGILAPTARLTVANGTSAIAAHFYNTFTDASNYERGVLDWSTTTNVLRIGTEAAGTGTVRNVALVGGNVGIGITSPACALDANGPIRAKTYTVATLPSASTVGAGAQAYVSDASSALPSNVGGIVASGGTNFSPVKSDGTNWRQM